MRVMTFVMFLVASFLGSSALACPNFAGSYEGRYASYSVPVKIKVTQAGCERLELNFSWIFQGVPGGNAETVSIGGQPYEHREPAMGLNCSLMVFWDLNRLVALDTCAHDGSVGVGYSISKGELYRDENGNLISKIWRIDEDLQHQETSKTLASSESAQPVLPIAP